MDTIEMSHYSVWDVSEKEVNDFSSFLKFAVSATWSSVVIFVLPEHSL